MHYHLEIIMPPTSKVEERIKEIMEPFNENNEDEEERSKPFWDFYVIGGRWSGNKLTQSLDDKQLKKFHEEIKKNKIMVHGFVAGKEEIASKEQTELVDKLWGKFFPEIGGECPLFKHYNNQYENSLVYPDVMKVKEIPTNLTASKVIVAHLDYEGKKFEAETMMEDSYYNGVSLNDSNWDKKVKTVIEKHNDSLKNAQRGYAAKRIVKDNWLAITVDYHT